MMITRICGPFRVMLVLCCLLASVSFAQPFSYVYIQGDKQTPFYVKLDGEMQPRYGKNYAILSRLAPGPAAIRILFQQNAFPPQEFRILIPADGYRSFMLSKRGDVFTLYDAVQHFYITAGEDISTDRLPVTKAAISPLAVKKTTTAPVDSPLKTSTAGLPSSDPRFIAGLELPPANGAASESISGIARDPVPVGVPNRALLKNSDCPAPIGSEDFGKLYNAILRDTDDEERLAGMLEKMDKCYASWQARSLCSALSGDAARFSLLKAIYPRISDQGEFVLLDDLLREAVWKAEFVKLTRR